MNIYTGQNASISDHSCPGLTIESFRKEGHLAAIYEYSKPGDFCFFQFDPMGQSLEDWMPKGAFRRQLARFIIECRERFMYPVLLTPAFRHNSTSTDDYTGQLQKQCLAAYQEVGKLTSTPVIELHKLHVITYDAYVAAGIVAKEIARVCSAYPERGYRFLTQCMDQPICVSS